MYTLSKSVREWLGEINRVGRGGISRGLCEVSTFRSSPVLSQTLQQGFSKGAPRHTSVPRNFWTVPREKVLGKCEHVKMGCVLNI